MGYTPGSSTTEINLLVIVSNQRLIVDKMSGPIEHAGLCSRSAQVPQVTNFFLWATVKTYVFHILSLNAGYPGFHG